MDETYLKVCNRWTYLYRAIDRDGNLIDATLSEHRDMQAAKIFFRSAHTTIAFRPDRVTTDGHGFYPKVIRTMLGRTVLHRTSAYLNNRVEQDHHGIEGRTRCMRGFTQKSLSRTTKPLVQFVKFPKPVWRNSKTAWRASGSTYRFLSKSHDAANRFCREHGKLRNHPKPRRRHNQIVSASPRRACFAKSTCIALDTMAFGSATLVLTTHASLLTQDLTEPIVQSITGFSPNRRNDLPNG